MPLCAAKNVRLRLAHSTKESLNRFQINACGSFNYRRFLLHRTIIVILFSILFINSKSQVTDTTIFPLNDYLVTTNNNPYPLVNNSKLNLIDTSRLINVLIYGAKGDGLTFDDASIVSAFNAAQSANTGVIFPSGKTFLVSKLNSINLSKNMTVWAYGATIKMAAFERYSAFQFIYPVNSRKNDFLWLGGTIDGNKDNQSWPGSPTGKTLWEEEHGQMIRVMNAGFALFKDVTVTNPVVDGVTFSKCRIAVISDCNANSGAPLRYNEVGDQGTYFKVRQTGGTKEGTAFYVNNTVCSYGSIGIHYSTNDVEDSSVTVLNNVQIYNGAQDAIHFEHSRRNFMYNCYIWRDTVNKIYNGSKVRKYSADIHVSNNTLIASIKKCQFKDARIDARNSSDMKIGVIDSCVFTNTAIGVCIDGTKGFTHILNSTIKGQSGTFQARANHLFKSTFQDFLSHNAMTSGMTVDSCTFINGSIQPIQLLNGGLVYQCTFTNCKNPNKNTTPSSDNWKKNFQGYIDILSDVKKYLGHIPLGMANTQNQLSSSVPSAALIKNKDIPGRPIVNLFPNPVVNILHLTFTEPLDGKISATIYDQLGNVVQTVTLYKNTSVSFETINVKQLSAGVYILHIVNGNRRISLKFIISNN
jgi:hypothetical protein